MTRLQTPGALGGEVTAVLAQLAATGGHAPVSLVRNTDLIRGFEGFLEHRGVGSLERVSPAVADEFVRCLTRSGSEPSVATMRLRRSALRLLYREAKALDLVNVDPTMDIALPSRTYRTARPLSEQELTNCRSFAEGMRGDKRYAIAWALAEATARVPELGKVRQDHIHESQALLPGCSMTERRRVPLTNWGVEVLANVATDSAVPILRVTSDSSVHELVAATLRRAGLSREPGVSPNSVPAWRGATELANGASIDEVTKLLGMRSLDRAARFIGFDWRGPA